MSQRNKNVGIILLAGLLLASSFITSSAFSIMIAIILVRMFNFSVLQSTALRRLIGIIQSAVIFVILVALGGFIWKHAFAAILGGTIGSYLGTKLSIKRVNGLQSIRWRLERLLVAWRYYSRFFIIL